MISKAEFHWYEAHGIGKKDMKIKRLWDEKAATHRLVRIIDESGEDYLYPSDLFVPIELPEAAPTC